MINFGFSATSSGSDSLSSTSSSSVSGSLSLSDSFLYCLFFIIFSFLLFKLFFSFSNKIIFSLIVYFHQKLFGTQFSTDFVIIWYRFISLDEFFSVTSSVNILFSNSLNFFVQQQMLFFFSLLWKTCQCYISYSN